MAWRDYFWPGTEVLRNKLGFRDAEELEAAEHVMTQVRRAEVRHGDANIDETFDAAHLRSCLHFWLFQDVYSWAGEYRKVEIAKLSRFAGPEQIEGCLNHAADTVAEVAWDAVDDDQFCDRAAAVYGWLNFAHPFREGNGRTARLFMSSVAQLAGRSLNYGAIRREVFIQRAAFSCPDLDQSEPDYQWMVPVFEEITGPAGDITISTEALPQQRDPGSHDLGR